MFDPTLGLANILSGLVNNTTNVGKSGDVAGPPAPPPPTPAAPDTSEVQRALDQANLAETLRVAFAADKREAELPPPSTKVNPLAVLLPVVLGTALGAIAGRGMGALAGASGAVSGVPAGIEAQQAQAMMDHKQRIASAEARLRERQDTASGIRMLLQSQPQIFSGMDAKLIGELAFPGMGFDAMNLDAKRKRDVDNELRYRLEDVDKRLSATTDPQEIQRLLGLRADLLYEPGTPERQAIGEANVEGLRKGEIPTFATIVDRYGQPGVDAYNRYVQSRDPKALMDELAKLPIIQKPTGSRGGNGGRSSGVTATYRQMAEMAAKIAKVKEINPGISDAEAMDLLPTEDRLVALELFKGKKGAGTQVRVQAEFDRIFASLDKYMDPATRIQEATRLTEQAIANIKRLQQAEDSKDQEATGGVPSDQATREKRIVARANLLWKNKDPRVVAKQKELEKSGMPADQIKASLVEYVRKLATEDLDKVGK